MTYKHKHSHLLNVPCGDDAMHSLPTPSAPSKELSREDEFLMRLSHLPAADMYDFTNTIIKGYTDHITVECIFHGEFTKSLSSMLNSGHGCKQCNKEFGINKLSRGEVIKLSRYIKNYERELDVEEVMVGNGVVNDSDMAIDYYDGELSSNTYQALSWLPAHEPSSHWNRAR